MDALRRAESIYRHTLLIEPGDTAFRLRLAWCLFIQAVHQAGRESILDTVECEYGGLNGLTPELSNGIEKSVDELLKDCVRQTTTVRQLTLKERDRSDAELLLSLVT